jgi:hypothetical protein
VRDAFWAGGCMLLVGTEWETGIRGLEVGPRDECHGVLLYFKDPRLELNDGEVPHLG